MHCRSPPHQNLKIQKSKQPNFPPLPLRRRLALLLAKQSKLPRVILFKRHPSFISLYLFFFFPSSFYFISPAHPHSKYSSSMSRVEKGQKKKKHGSPSLPQHYKRLGRRQSKLTGQPRGQPRNWRKCHDKADRDTCLMQDTTHRGRENGPG